MPILKASMGGKTSSGAMLEHFDEKSTTVLLLLGGVIKTMMLSKPVALRLNASPSKF